MSTEAIAEDAVRERYYNSRYQEKPPPKLPDLALKPIFKKQVPPVRKGDPFSVG